MRRAALVLLALLAALPAAAAAQVEGASVRVEELEGDRRDRFRRTLVRTLERRGVTVDDGASLVIAGRVRRRGRAAELELRDGDATETLSLRGPPARVLRRAVRGIEAWLEARAAASEAPPAPEPEPEPASVAEAVPRPPPRAPAPAARPEGFDPGEAMRFAPTALRVWAGVYGYSRQLSFRDDVFGRLGGYAILPGFAAHVGFEYYPLRHLSNELFAHVGVGGFARGMALEPSGDDAGNSYAARAHAWEIDLRYQLPIDAHAITGSVGLGNERFGVDPAGPSTPEERIARSPVPSVDYVYVRPAVAAELHLAEGIFVGASFGWRFLTSTGELEAWFPRNRGSGFDAGAWVTYRPTWFFELRLTGEHHRYFFGLRPRPGDELVAGGAVDEWVGFSLDAILRLPGTT